jgi:hypothetical protein
VRVAGTPKSGLLREIRERLEASRAAVLEHKRLEAALRALGNVVGGELGGGAHAGLRMWPARVGR